MAEETALSAGQIAMVAYEANRAYRKAAGMDVIPIWSVAGRMKQDLLVAAVTLMMESDPTDEELDSAGIADMNNTILRAIVNVFVPHATEKKFTKPDPIAKVILTGALRREYDPEAKNPFILFDRNDPEVEIKCFVDDSDMENDVMDVLKATGTLPVNEVTGSWRVMPDSNIRGFDVDKIKILEMPDGMKVELKPSDPATARCFSRIAQQLAIMRTALQTLTCLGNGDEPGNSDGNKIAIQAIEECKALDVDGETEQQYQAASIKETEQPLFVPQPFVRLLWLVNESIRPDGELDLDVWSDQVKKCNAIMKKIKEASQQFNLNMPQTMSNLLETAFALIANVGAGDWSKQSKDWYDAAVRFRDEYNDWIGKWNDMMKIHVESDWVEVPEFEKSGRIVDDPRVEYRLIDPVAPPEHLIPGAGLLPDVFDAHNEDAKRRAEEHDRRTVNLTAVIPFEDWKKIRDSSDLTSKFGTLYRIRIVQEGETIAEVEQELRANGRNPHLWTSDVFA